MSGAAAYGPWHSDAEGEDFYAPVRADELEDADPDEDVCAECNEPLHHRSDSLLCGACQAEMLAARSEDDE